MTQRALFENEIVSGLPVGDGAFTTTELPRRALTLWQPWAWLVAHGHKPIENRSPGFAHKSFRGWFWIHAGKLSDRDEKRVANGEATDAWLAAHDFCCQHNFLGMPALDDASMHFGAIIGRARIIGVIEPHPREPVRWHMPDQYGFILADATALKTPVPCRGYQAFWRVTASVLEQLRVAT